jgi:hypothetical protein
MYCRCTWLLFYYAFASMWVSTSTLLTIGMVHCHGYLGNTCYSSVFLLKIPRYRTMPVPKHVRVFYSQQKLGSGHRWVLTVACFFCVPTTVVTALTGLCFYFPLITHYECVTISEHFVLYLYHLLKQTAMTRL